MPGVAPTTTGTCVSPLVMWFVCWWCTACDLVRVRVRVRVRVKVRIRVRFRFRARVWLRLGLG